MSCLASRNWTYGDILGHAADVWGSKSREFLSSPAATAMILPLLMILYCASRPGVPLLIPSWQYAFRREWRTPCLDVPRGTADEDPPRTGRGCENSNVRKAGGNAGSLDSPPGESKFIDDHVAGFVNDHLAGAD